jgi:hypothetical protein
VGAAAGVPAGFIAGLALTALAVPGIGVLGIAGLFAVGAASGLGGAMLGGRPAIDATGPTLAISTSSRSVTARERCDATRGRGR